ncbi:MAG: hypothetical protein WBM03_06030, partial [Steroidobacteraceae bacterium]
MSLRSSAFVLGFAVIPALQGRVAAPPFPTGTRQRLDALVENYFEDNLRASPLLATHIGEHRYDDQLP